MKLSIVIAARNDNYLPRLLRSLFVLRQFSERNGFSPELIVVEWNPLPGCLTLPEIFEATKTHARIITVSNEIHRAQRGADAMPFFEYQAKNVGIRRSCEEYVLCCNCDGIFSEGLVKVLGSSEGTDCAYYRANRHDVKMGNAWGSTPEEIIESCKWNTYKVVLADEGAAGDFTLMHRDRWHEIHGNPELVSDDTIDTYTTVLARARGMLQIVFSEGLYHQGHASQRDGWPSIGGGTGIDKDATCRENEDSWGLAGIDLPEVTV